MTTRIAGAIALCVFMNCGLLNCGQASAALPPTLPLPKVLPPLEPQQAAETNVQARDRLIDSIVRIMVEYPPSQFGNAPVAPNLRGLLFYRAGLDRPVSEIDRAIAANPKDAEAHAARGMEYLAGVNPQEAAREIAIALSLDANCASAHIGHGWLLLLQGDDQGALDEFNRADVLAPAAPDAYWARTITAFETKDKALFFANADALLRRAPDAQVAYALRGLGLLFSGEAARAKADFERFAQLAPEAGAAYAALCTIYNFDDDARHGVQYCDRAIALRPDWALAYIARGSVEEEIDRYDRAVADASKAIALDPSIPYAYGLRCGSLVHMQQLDSGLADCDKEDALAPDNTTTGLARGIGYTAAGRYQDALDVLTRTIDRFPYMAEAYMDRGNTYGVMGDYASAVKDWTMAIGKTPERALLYTGRGAMFLMEGDYRSAADDYARAIALDPKAADPRGRLGMALFALGRYAEAEPQFEKRVELDPASPYAVLWLHVIRLKLKKNDDAELRKNAQALPLNRWPGQIISMFEGTLAPEGLRNAVAEAERRNGGNYSCELDFFTGELLLAQNRKAEARPLFENSAKICPNGSASRIGASGEARQAN